MGPEFSTNRLVNQTIADRTGVDQLAQNTQANRNNGVASQTFAGAQVRINQGQRGPEQITKHTKNGFLKKFGAVAAAVVTTPFTTVAGFVVGTVSAGVSLTGSVLGGLAGGVAKGAAAGFKKGGGGVGGAFLGFCGGVVGAVGGVVGGLVGGAGLAAQQVVSGTVTGAMLPMAYAADQLRDGLMDAKNEVLQTRAELGQPLPDSIMNNNIEFKMARGSDSTQRGTVRDAMLALREHVGGDKRISQDQMLQYIHMGERIALAIEGQDNYDGGPIIVDGREIKPNLENTRALSWYMQAKGVSDNNAQGNTRPIAMMSKGAMVINDPKGNLFKFMKSSNNTYGRASTHFNERSTGDVANFSNTGFAGMAAGMNKQGAQYGIEDFSTKMPSGGGCLLFDQLQSSDDNSPPQLFMKWESAGMPTVYGTGTHADDAQGWSAKVKNRYLSQYRCIGHTMNFAKSIAGGHSDGVLAARREAVKKGLPKAVFNDFKALVADMESAGVITSRTAKDFSKDAKTYGLNEMDFMLNALGNVDMSGLKGAERASFRGRMNNLQNEIDSLVDDMGEDIGIERKGAEIHASMPSTVEQQQAAQQRQAMHDAVVNPELPGIQSSQRNQSANNSAPSLRQQQFASLRLMRGGADVNETKQWMANGLIDRQVCDEVGQARNDRDFETIVARLRSQPSGVKRDFV